MKKVIIENSVNVDVMIEKMKGEFEYLNNGYDYESIKSFILENGSGIYEFGFGCRGGLEEFDKNDEYMSLDELVGENLDLLEEGDSIEDLKEGLSDYYNDNDNFVLEDENFVKCVSLYEECYSVFVNVVV